MAKTVLINVVGLCSSHITNKMPFLNAFVKKNSLKIIDSVFPALTCPVQSTYLTGKMPQEHGIVGNGWYYKEMAEINFWKQSNHLVQGEKIWDAIKKENPKLKTANLFWWFNMYSGVDYSITPRPLYPADGRKIPDIYTNPPGIRESIQKDLGDFPLFHFWGPKTSIKSSAWIADAALWLEEKYDLDLSLIYLPHLDYVLQRQGPGSRALQNDLTELDLVLKKLIGYYVNKNASIILVSEYGIVPVNRAIAINRVLREHKWIQVRQELGLEILDPGASSAFAVADHQIAHIYVNDKSQLSKIRKVLENTAGIAELWDEDSKEKNKINHSRSGDFIAIAEKNSWFSYYYWMDDKFAPDFARTVDIHRKPGYDPVELFLDPEIKFPHLKVIKNLIKKKMGFRYLMDVISLDAGLVKGSHGRVDNNKDQKAICITNFNATGNKENMKAEDVYKLILQSVLN